MSQKYEARLVSLNVMTRVVVPIETSFEDTYSIAEQRLIDNIKISGIDLVEDIFEDTEVPFDPIHDNHWIKE